jgi:hypothetical protein
MGKTSNNLTGKPNVDSFQVKIVKTVTAAIPNGGD